MRQALRTPWTRCVFLVAWLTTLVLGSLLAQEPAGTEKIVRKEITNSIGMRLVLIPAGKFLMGSPESDYDAKQGEKPQHEVEITKAFYLGKYEVTRGQFRRFVADNGYKTTSEKAGGGATWKDPGINQTDEHPVVWVDWHDAKAFCDWLSQKEGKIYRLPTEAEWEFCCRAGTTTPFYFGETISTQQANYNGEAVYDNGKKAIYSELLEGVEAFFGVDVHGKGKKGIYRERSTPVDNFSANPWGLHDMHGNLWQWCQDFYGEYPTDDVTDPQGPKKGQDHVLRGGSWSNFPENCRSATRAVSQPSFHSDYYGLRVCFYLDQ